jgi:hypothetical protein
MDISEMLGILQGSEAFIPFHFEGICHKSVFWIDLHKTASVKINVLFTHFHLLLA